MTQRIVESLIRSEVVRFVVEAPANRLNLDNLPIYDTPLVGFARGKDPVFNRLKTVIGSFHRTPFEMMQDYAALRGGQDS